MFLQALNKIYYTLKKCIHIFSIEKILKKFKFDQNIVIIGTPLNGNIGDHAIAIAQNKLLEKTNINIVEIPELYYELYLNKIKNKIKENDVIVIQGGGFLGTLWINREKLVRNIITNFRSNKIIIMPQTIYFEDTEYGKMELEISKQIYNSHSNLYMVLRDKRSYNFCKRHFIKAKLELLPDMVMYLDYTNPKLERDYILFCLRNDKEKSLNNDTIRDVLKYVNSKNVSTKCTDTVVSNNISLKKRDLIFLNKLNEFKASKLIITDRLHGMIFSAITATPCIAFDNISSKISGVYKWLNHLNYIKVVKKDDNNYKEVIDELLNIKNCKYKNLIIKKNLQKINNIIMNSNKE